VAGPNLRAAERGRVPARARPLASRVGGEVRLFGRAIARGATRFLTGDHLTYASSIAYYALLSLFPFLLLALSILGSVSSEDADRAEILRFVFRYFPRQFGFISTQLEALTASRVRLGVVGSLVMVWAAMGVFGAITSAVNHAWGVERRRSFLRHKLVSFLMLLAAGVLLVTALVLVSALSVVESSWFVSVIAQAPGAHTLVRLLLRSASLLLLIFVVGLIFYFVPNAKVRFRDVWEGAILTGLLWQAALSIFSWYLRDLSRFHMVHGSIAAVVVFLIWVYTSAMILLFGVEVAAACARLRGDRRDSEPAAPPLE
jgi:membrane protein